MRSIPFSALRRLCVRPLFSRTIGSCSLPRSRPCISSHPLRTASPSFVRLYGSSSGPSQHETEERVLSVLKNFDKVDQGKLSLATPFTQLGLDSLDVVEVMIALEEEFHMEIPDAVADKAENSKDIANYIYGFLNPHKPQPEDKVSEDPDH